MRAMWINFLQIKSLKGGLGEQIIGKAAPGAPNLVGGVCAQGGHPRRHDASGWVQALEAFTGLWGVSRSGKEAWPGMRVYQSRAMWVGCPPELGEPLARPQSAVVLEADGVPRKTGLLDCRGNPIVAVDIMGPIGFERGPQK